jgi:methyl-accepting chemotaxis protein
MKQSRSYTTGLTYTVFAVVAVVIGSAIHLTSARNGAVQDAYVLQAELKELGIRLADASDYLTDEVRRYAQFGDRAHYDNYWREVNETKTREQVVSRLGELGATDTELGLLEQAKASSDALIALEDSAMKLVAGGELESARRILFGSDYEAAKKVIMAPIGEFQESLASRTATQVSQARAAAELARLVLIVVTAVVMLGVVVAFTLFRRRFAQPIRALSDAARSLARGRVDVTVDVVARDELGDLVSSFNEMTAGLRTQVDVVRRVAAGDLDVDIAPRSDEDALALSMASMVATLRSLIQQTVALADAAEAGRLSQRGTTDGFRGAYRQVVDGMNRTLDRVVAPIDEATRVLECIAEQDLTARMQGTYAGDFARIKEAIDAAASNLEDAIEQVGQATEEVSSASGQIASGSQALAQSASEQASSLEEVSSSLHELASMTRQNATGAHQARELADEARVSAERGRAEMARLAQAVDRIKSSSDATARIVRTIDEIAFQTNLLALNAAVEAARAGDAGKGFAVVAEEVRALAMRSAEAARSTADMIEDAVRNADEGVSLNANVTAQLEDIHDRAEKVGHVLAEVTMASQQQSEGVTQISTAVEDMNGVTQQVASSSEESASAAEELSAQAAHMRSLVGRFRVNGSPTAARKSLPTRGGPKHLHAPAERANVRGGSRLAGARASASGSRSAAELIPFHEDEATLAEF